MLRCSPLNLNRIWKAFKALVELFIVCLSRRGYEFSFAFSICSLSLLSFPLPHFLPLYFPSASFCPYFLLCYFTFWYREIFLSRPFHPSHWTHCYLTFALCCFRSIQFHTPTIHMQYENERSSLKAFKCNTLKIIKKLHLLISPPSYYIQFNWPMDLTLYWLRDYYFIMLMGI